MKPFAPLCLLLLAAASLAGCTQFPELDRTQTAQLEAAEYPPLVSLDQILAQAQAPQAEPAQTQSNLDGRLSGLRARANRMRGAVLTEQEKRRLDEGLR